MVEMIDRMIGQDRFVTQGDIQDGGRDAARIEGTWHRAEYGHRDFQTATTKEGELK
jgi:hypothetical protein